MIIKSTFSKATVYWRIFKPDDSAHWVGLKDGLLRNGEETAPFTVPGFNQFQIEFKRDGVLGALIVKATPRTLYHDSDTLNLGDDGSVSAETAPPAALALESRWSGGPVRWRVFDPGDILHVSGYLEGDLDPGLSQTIPFLGRGTIQLDISRGGRIVIPAGNQYYPNDRLALTDQGLTRNGGFAVPLPHDAMTIRLTSAWSAGSIYWRLFGPDDTTHALGLPGKDGILARGASVSVTVDGQTQVQLEIKKHGLSGTPLVVADPQRLWRNGANLTMTDGGLFDGNTVVIPAPAPPPAPARVPLSSTWPFGTVYWSLFKPDDTSYLADLAHGTLSSGQSTTLEFDPFAKLKLRILRNDALGPVLAAPGPLWGSGDDLQMRKEGLTNHGAIVAASPSYVIATLSSTWPAPIYWSVFLRDDSLRSAPLAAGVISTGGTASLSVNNDIEGFQLSIKKSDTLEELIPPGHVWPKGAKLAFDARRQLVPPEPRATGKLQILIDDPHGAVPFVACFVEQDVPGGESVTHTSDGTGRVPYFGGTRIEVRRGTTVVCTATTADISGGALLITAARMSRTFATLRAAFAGRADTEIRPYVNRILAKATPSTVGDFANFLGRRTITDNGKLRPIRLTDFDRPYNEKEFPPDGGTASPENPCILAANIAFTACVSRVLDGATQEGDVLIASLAAWFESLRDPQLPVLRRRVTDRRDHLDARLAVLHADSTTDVTIKQAEIDFINELSKGTHAWQMEPSIDEYSGLVHGLSAIANWGPETVMPASGGVLHPAELARDSLSTIVDHFRERSFFVTSAVNDVEVLSARGATGQLVASAFLNAAAQTNDSRDLFSDGDIPRADYPSLRAATLAQHETHGDGVALNDLIQVALTGGLGPMVAAAAIAGTVALGVAVPLGLVPAAASMAGEILAHPTRPSAYFRAGAGAMATELWGLAPWWSGTLFDRASMAATRSTEFVRNWARSLPRHDPKGGYHVIAGQMRNCAQLLCQGTLDSPQDFLNTMLDPRLAIDPVGDAPSNLWERSIQAWAVACLALGIHPGLQWPNFQTT